MACIAVIASATAWPIHVNLASAQDAAQQREFFESKVRPLLAERCWNCHSGSSGESEGNLRLDHGSLIATGGDSGPAVVANDPDASLLMQAVLYQGYEMPPDGRLPDPEIAILREWIASGAYWPDEALPEDTSQHAGFDLASRRNTHWAWQPRAISIPSLAPEDNWSCNAIDRFVLARMQSEGLAPNHEPDRNTLTRRVYLDLIGLPPSVEDLDAVQSDPDPDWYARLVDRLLADPQFGVRWARHWLDLVRFAQSRGHEFDEDIPAAEEYRDYVVRAINDDLPYDQFLVEHVAGDLVPSPRTHPMHGGNESILGTGFWHLGEWVHSPVDTRKDETDRFDNMVDVLSKSFMGMTVACARCHDHKFDAISTQDYYAMFGFLRSSHYRLVRYETDPIHRRASEELQQRRQPLQNQAKAMLLTMAGQLMEAGTLFDPEQEAGRTLAKQLLDTDAIERSMLPEKDPRIRFDARTADARLWSSDGVVFGPTHRPPLSISFNPHSNPRRWTIHRFPEGARDPFWNSMLQEVSAVNRQNRFSQVEEAGKILPTASFPLESGKLSYLVRGSFRAFVSVDSHRLIAGPLHGETLLESQGSESEYRWVTHGLERYRGKTVHVEFAPIKDQPFAIVQVIDGPAPTIVPHALDASRVENALSEARESLRQWAQHPESMNLRQASLSATVLEAIANNGDGLDEANPLRASWGALMDTWSATEQQLRQRLPWKSRLALAMRDGSGINDQVLIRGNHLRPGEEVPRRNLEALAPHAAPYSGPGSGRYDLALSLIHPDNPLVARVVANRVWHHLLGRGIAPTTDDLGVLGSAPSHPELLDYLANRTLEHAWSLKSLVREICMSKTYQQDSRPSSMAQQVDPDNVLLSHARVRRLEAESVRDTLFAIAGELDLRGMPESSLSVPVHLTDFLEGRGRPGRNGPLDGAGRRSLFLEVRRNFLNPLMSAFDTPNPFSAMGRRNVSNVPAQALILLNDPLVHELADRWARRVLLAIPEEEARVAEMIRSATARQPTPQEMELALDFVRSPEFAEPIEAYRSLAHMLLNNKELLFRF